MDKLRDALPKDEREWGKILFALGTGNFVAHSFLRWRQLLFTLPLDEAIELPGRPHVTYEVRDYHRPDRGAKCARDEIGFLFKAFETGQARPPRPGTVQAKMPRAATIHEFLDWTVQGNPERDNDAWKSYPQDFDGFIVVCMLQRHRPAYPSPVHYDSVPATEPQPKPARGLGGPGNPMPYLIRKGKPIVAATIRAGPDYVEVPFFATVDHRKGRGFGRCLLEAIEDICRSLNIGKIMLCSENIERTKNIWQRMGFQITTDSDWAALNVRLDDMLHMDNTVQMHKIIPPRKPWRSIVIKHQHLKQRVYCPWQPGSERPGLVASVPGYSTPNHMAFPSMSRLSSEAQPSARSGGTTGIGGGMDDDDETAGTQQDSRVPSKVVPRNLGGWQYHTPGDDDSIMGGTSTDNPGRGPGELSGARGGDQDGDGQGEAGLASKRLRRDGSVAGPDPYGSGAGLTPRFPLENGVQAAGPSNNGAAAGNGGGWSSGAGQWDNPKAAHAGNGGGAGPSGAPPDAPGPSNGPSGSGAPQGAGPGAGAAAGAWPSNGGQSYGQGQGGYGAAPAAALPSRGPTVPSGTAPADPRIAAGFGGLPGHSAPRTGYGNWGQQGFNQQQHPQWQPPPPPPPLGRDGYPQQQPHGQHQQPQHPPPPPPMPDFSMSSMQPWSGVPGSPQAQIPPPRKPAN